VGARHIPKVIAPAATSRPRAAFAIGAALFFGTLLLFARVCGRDFDFVNYDDPDYVTANEHVKAGLNAAGVKWAMSASVASNWHPLTWMSHMLDWSLFGANPRGHHATSVVLHALNALLAFLAFQRLTGALWTSAICAALFAWHPLRAESVAWVAERKDVLSGFFWFVALWAYAVYVDRRRNGTRGAMWFYAVALVAFALGLMAKPMLVTLPCVLLLLDVWPLKRLSSLRSAGWLLLEKLPFFLLTAVSARITYLVQKESGAVTDALSLSARLENAAVSVVRYLGKFLAPFDLAVLYPHPGEWPARKVAAGLVIIVALTALAAWQLRRRPWIAIGWLWFLGTLVPVIGIVQVGLQSMADRYTYLTMLGVELAVLWSIRDWAVSAAARRGCAVATVAVLLFCAARTWNQLGVWKNSFTLFDHAIAVTENNYLAHDNRGLFLYKSGKVEEAIADYRAALAINPSYLNANNNLGHALYELGRPAEAIPFFRTALKAKSDHLEVRNNLANALSDVGQLDEAMEHYEFVLARQPNHVNALNGSGVVLAMRGKPAEAKAQLEKALALAPDNASAHNNLGNVCSMLNQLGEAAQHYQRAAQLQPNAHTHAVLGYTLSRLGRREEAIRELKTALQLQPNDAQAKAWLEQLK
jgi:tetratricopeptide (TPR) repeat protein